MLGKDLFNIMKAHDSTFFNIFTPIKEIENPLECFEYILENLDMCDCPAIKKRVFENLVIFYSTHAQTINEKYNYYPNMHRYNKRFVKVGTAPDMQYNTTSAKKTIPNDEGLYLIGQCAFNPFTYEEFYWVKVGKASDIAKRMAQYATHSPMIWKQDFLLTDSKKETAELEKYCHDVLSEIAIEKGEKSSEWFRVSREMYLEICKKGFWYFVEK